MARRLRVACCILAALAARTARAQISDCEEGDHFATAIAVLGDVDGDCVDDFVVSDPWREQGYEDEGWIAAVSGSTRRILWSVFAGDCHQTLGLHAWSVSDLDGDGARDVEVSAGWYLHHDHVECWTFSGASGRLLRCVAYPDLPARDTSRDLTVEYGEDALRRLALHSYERTHVPHVAVVESIRQGEASLLTLEDLYGVPRVVQPVPAASWAMFLAVVGDVDGDCREDVLTCTEASFWASYSLRSGEDLAIAWEARETLDGIYDFAWATCGDLDGDEFRDLLYGASRSSGAPPVHGYVEARSSRDGAVLFRVTRADLVASAPR